MLVNKIGRYCNIPWEVMFINLDQKDQKELLICDTYIKISTHSYFNPTDSFEGAVPASSSKRKATTAKTSPYFNPTFQFTTPTQTTATLTKSTKKSTGKKTTVTGELV